MEQPDIKIAQALCVLQSQSPDAYLAVRGWFMDSSSKHDNTLRNAEPPHILYNAQGSSRELLEICDYLADPQELLKKLSMKKAGIRSLP